LHKHADIGRLFGDLRFIVIDEVHSLLRGDRGGQTLCLIERLSRLAGINPRRIGLSATIGDPESAGAFLASGTGKGTVIPKIENKGVTWRLSMEHFFIQGEQSADNKAVPDAMPVLDEKTDDAPKNADPGMGYIFEHTRGRKCLVFVNSREECEAVTTTLRQYCEAQNEPDRFLIHHGNLSASYRETAEAVMKDDDQLQTTVTTATLELGIDIGRLERAFQVDAPFTVSSFLQRMGRTGRREQPPEMWFVMREEEPEARAMLPATIPWTLLQGIALVQAYREERWVEPPKLDRLPFSLLYHQTMCILASCGEMPPAVLASRALSLSYFHRIDQEDYRLLLKHLLATDHIQKTEEGGLIVGLAGERQTNSYKFYAVFKENEEYTVRNRSQELGTIVSPPPVGEKIALAGHVWIVEEVDHKRRLIYCDAVKGKVPAYFGLCPGDINTKILEKMRDILRSDAGYPYLMKNAVARLAEARRIAVNSGLTEEPLICLGGDMWCLFPWLGTYAFIALERFIKIKCAARLTLSALDSSKPYFIQFTMKADKKTFFDVLIETANQPLDPMELVYDGEVPVFEKYDEFLPEALVRKGFAHGILGIEEMRTRIRGWGAFTN
ncbi:MAG: ATP-dependent helicase, partial [Planctomycetota bacterium]|nr:ATP-dependent helicase [Planctomycetota bacterium]